MKKLTYLFPALLMLVFIIQSCQKNGVHLKTPLQIVATKYVLNVNNLDTLALIGTTPADSVHWFVTPANYQNVQRKYNHLILAFLQAGNYRVKAIVNGTDSAFVSITVNGTVSPPKDTVTVPATPTLLPLTGDQITLLSNFYQSKLKDTTYVYFTAETQKTYPCANSSINFTSSLSSNNYSVNFIDVQQPGASSCMIGAGTLATPVIPFKPANYVTADGTYPLNVTLNGTTYTGTITVSATSVVFNWIYTSGVLIAPKQINR